MPPQKQGVFVYWLLFTIQLALTVVSAGVWILWFSGRWQGRLEELAPSAPVPANPVGVLIVVFLAGESLALAVRRAITDMNILITVDRLHEVALLALVQLGLLLITLRLTGTEPWSAWGLHTIRWSRQFTVGVVAFLASILPVVAVLLATNPWRDEANQHPLLQLLQQSPSLEVIGWIAVNVVVLAPLVEELMYRVVLQSSLERWWNPAAALVVTAVLFSAVHGWPDGLPLLPLAIVMGYVFQRSRSYLAVVALHAAFNVWNLVAALLAPPSAL